MMTMMTTMTTTFHPWGRYPPASAGGFYSNEPPLPIKARSGSDGTTITTRIGRLP